MMTKVLLLSFAVLVSLDAASCYRILVLCPAPAKSHNILARGVVEILHDANHDVTFITGVKTEKPKYREIFIPESPAVLKYADLLKFENISKVSKFALLFLMPEFFTAITDAVFESDEVIKIMNDENENFDLVIVEYFMNHALAGFGVKYSCPVILLSPVALMQTLAKISGTPVSPATVPNIFLTYTNHMTLQQRIVNVLSTLAQEIYLKLVSEPADEALYVKHFPKEAERFPYSRFPEIISLIFTNSHPLMGSTRALPPNVVEVGGFHISEGSSLSSEYQKNLDEAKNGVIYFSMGSNLKSADFPEELKANILKAFRKRNELILWKYEEDLPNKPNNVIIRSWMPQASILKHPNIKLFISHGGLLGTTEAVSAGVPVLAIPIYGDQFINAHNTQERGCGVVLEYANVTESSLSWALNEAIENPKYSTTAKHINTLFHDRPMKPRELVKYYAEQVIRTGGAKHLSPPRLPLYSLVLLDVVTVVLLPPLLIVIACYIIYGKCCKKNSTKAQHKRKTE